MSKCVVFPSGKETEARAYADWTNAQFAILAPGQGTFAYPEKARNDVHGQWVTAYYGPDFKWFGVDVSEPTSSTADDDGPTQRADGEIADPEWPKEE